MLIGGIKVYNQYKRCVRIFSGEKGILEDLRIFYKQAICYLCIERQKFNIDYKVHTSGVEVIKTT